MPFWSIERLLIKFFRTFFYEAVKMNFEVFIHSVVYNLYAQALDHDFFENDLFKPNKRDNKNKKYAPRR